MNKSLLVFCALVLLSAGCAAPNITSDHIMFPMDPENDPKRDKKMRFDISSQFSAELPMYGKAIMNEHIRNNPEAADRNLVHEFTVSTLSASFFALNFANSKFTWGISLQQQFTGVPALDFTVKFKDNYYLSLGGFGWGGHALLQKRLSWNGRTGSAIGIYGNYRLHPYFYTSFICDDDDDTCIEPFGPNGSFFGPELDVYTSFIGIRYKHLTAGARKKWGKGDRSWMITAGYNPRFKSLGVRMGYTF